MSESKNKVSGTCSCIRNYFNFNLDFTDCEVFVYTDLSDWMDENTHDLPEEYEIEVITPGRKNAVIITVSATKPVKITSKDLFNSSTQRCIPDGTYCFSIDSCGYKYSRFVPVTCKIQCSIDNLTAGATDLGTEEKAKELQRLLEQYRNSAVNQQSDQSVKLFKVLKRELDKLDCNC